MKLTKNLTEGNIYKNMLLYALPLILSSLLSQAYSTIDGIIAGKLIDEFALGAISATSSFELLFSSLIGGFCAGFAIYVSHLFGKKSYDAIKRDVFSMALFVATLSVVVSVLAILFRGPIFDYLNVDPLLYRNAEIYFIIYTAGYVLFFTNRLLVEVLYALGVTSFSLYVSIMSTVLNVAGNLFFLLVFRMGVAGLAVSTLLSTAAATVLYVVMLCKAFREMKCEPVSYRFDPSAVKRSLRYSLPTSAQQLAFHGVSFLIAPAINGLGAAATTAYNISNRLYLFGTQCLWSATSAFACYTGQCVGEGNAKKIRRGLKAGFILNVLLVLPTVLVIALFARPVVSLFFPDGYTGDAFLYAVRYAQIFLPFVYLQVVGHIFHAYLRSLGSITTVLGITILGSITRVAATLILIPLLQLDGAYLGQICSWAIDALICVVLYFFFYRTEQHLERILRHVDEYTKS